MSKQVVVQTTISREGGVKMSTEFLVSKEQLIHDLAILWLQKVAQSCDNPDRLAYRYFELVKYFQLQVEEASRYDFNVDPPAKFD